MSPPLKDIRAKVGVESWAIIKGMATAFDKEEGEIVRQIIHEYTDRMSHATRVADALLIAEGIKGNRRD